MTAVGTHVVFGTGPAGRAVATALIGQGTRVRMVNRTGGPVLTGVETIGGDATDVDFAREVAADADTVYFCLNAPNYHRWADEFPPLQRAVLGAATSAGAKLVVLENLYMYGPSTGPLHETTPVNPTSAKSRTRAAMSAELLDAHRRGEVRIVIGRASDFVGPGVRDSALGQFVFQPALAGKRAQTMGRPDTQHTYSYVPDVGRNLVLLGSRDDADGQVWHLPNPETRTTRHIIIDVYAAAGQRRTDVTALNRPMLRTLGLFNRNVRELLHTHYQFAAPFIVDDSAFRHTFGGHTTNWADIVASTVDWYRAHAIQPEYSHGLAEATTLGWPHDVVIRLAGRSPPTCGHRAWTEPYRSPGGSAANRRPCPWAPGDQAATAPGVRDVGVVPTPRLGRRPGAAVVADGDLMPGRTSCRRATLAAEPWFRCPAAYPTSGTSATTERGAPGRSACSLATPRASRRCRDWSECTAIGCSKGVASSATAQRSACRRGRRCAGPCRRCPTHRLRPPR